MGTTRPGALATTARQLPVRRSYHRESQIMATTMVHVRLDEKTKQRAAKTLTGMGISVSDAVRSGKGKRLRSTAAILNELIVADPTRGAQARAWW